MHMSVCVWAKVWLELNTAAAPELTDNAEAVLEDTIQSVISQTYHHVEYIIIDGASKDRTLAIAERYRDRITLLVSEPDKGAV